MEERKIEKRVIVLHIIESLFSLLILAWYLVTWLHPEPFKLIPLLMPFTVYKGSPFAWVLISGIFTFGIAAVCLFKPASFFLRRSISFLACAERMVPLLLNIVISLWILVNTLPSAVPTPSW